MDRSHRKKGVFRWLSEFALDKDVSDAVEAQKKVGESYPEFSEGHYNLGILHYSQGKVQEAIESYKKAIQIDPKNAKAHKNLGEIYAIQEQYDLAWKHAEIAESLGNSKLMDMLRRYLRQ